MKQALIKDLYTSFQLANQNLSFRLTQNRRLRSTRLLISPEEGIVVETPRKPRLKRALNLLYSKEDWLLKELQTIKKKQDQASLLKRHTHSVLVFGAEKQIAVKFNQRKDFVLENDHHIYLGYEKSRMAKIQIENDIGKWLMQKAELYLPKRVKHLNHRHQFKINKIVIKDQKTIWGSCTEMKNINLNWRIIMAPKWIGDYIIFHEMCHLKHLNHSTRFWNLVAQVCPRYEKAEKWIRDYGFLLHVNLFNQV